jgi:hypothetical protein
VTRRKIAARQILFININDLRLFCTPALSAGVKSSDIWICRAIPRFAETRRCFGISLARVRPAPCLVATIVCARLRAGKPGTDHGFRSFKSGNQGQGKPWSVPGFFSGRSAHTEFALSSHSAANEATPVVEAPRPRTFAAGSVSSARRSVQRAQEIRFADLDAVVTQDRIGRRRVEIEVRQRVLQQIIEAREGLGLPADRPRD